MNHVRKCETTKMPLTRNRSNERPSQLKRNISGPIAIGSYSARAGENELARRWLLRVGIVVTFFILPVVVYLAVSISSLQSALLTANQNQNRLISELQTTKHSGIRRDTSRLPPKIVFQHKEVLVLTTTLGEIRIVMRPDLSKESVQYIEEVVRTGCKRCNLYRAEPPGVLQGAMEGATANAALTPKAPCPAGYEHFPNPCIENESASCGCHGPVMSRGLVAWAAGFTGPDFFVNNYPHERATWWGTTHTCFGEIQDEASFAVVEAIMRQPTHEHQEGLRHILNNLVEFTMKIEEQSIKMVE